MSALIAWLWNDASLVVGRIAVGIILCFFTYVAAWMWARSLERKEQDRLRRDHPLIGTDGRDQRG